MIKTQFLLLCSILKTRLEVYLNVFIALRIMLNCPNTVASAETSFSKLKLIKTFRRYHMTNSRLSTLAMLSIETSCVRSLDLEDVIKVFACQKTHSKPFWYCCNVTLFMIFSWLLSCNIFHVCYCAIYSIQWFLLFCCMTTAHQLSSPAGCTWITVTTKSWRIATLIQQRYPFSPAKAPNLVEFAILKLARRLSQKAIQTIHAFSKSCRQNRKKNVFRFWCGISGGDVTKKACFVNFGHLWPALGPNPLTHSFGSKLCWKLGQNPRL